MLAPSLLRAGLALKLNQIKLAMRSYLRDRTNQATDTVTSYAVAAGLFAAAGIFLIAACLVGITALFRWIEIKYGLFWAFGVVGGLLVLIAAICAAIAVRKLHPRHQHFPSLASRLRVAINASPVKSGQIETARDSAAAVLQTSPAPVTTRNREVPQPKARSGLDNRNMGAGLILIGTLLGWAAVRRRDQARRTAV